MLPKQLQQKPSKMLASETKKNRLIFWQGYLFSIGVGGLIVWITNYFKDFIYQKFDVIVIVLNFMLIFSGIYGIIVGYFAGSIWGLRKQLLKKTNYNLGLLSVIISTPLTIYLFNLTEINQRKISYMLTFAFFHWLFLTFFTMLGILVGVRRVEKQAIE
jgi:hypothetical protein